jgi:hypothetical protein
VLVGLSYEWLDAEPGAVCSHGRRRLSFGGPEKVREEDDSTAFKDVFVRALVPS